MNLNWKTLSIALCFAACTLLAYYARNMISPPGERVQQRVLTEDEQQFVDELASVEEVLNQVDHSRIPAVDVLRVALNTLKTSALSEEADPTFQYGRALRDEVRSHLDSAMTLRRLPSLPPDQPAEADSETLWTQMHAKRKTATDTPQEEQGNTSAVETAVSPLVAQLESKLESQLKAKNEQLAAEKKRMLEIEFVLDRPDVDRLLTAFTTPGQTYCDADGKSKSTELRPVSLAFLKKRRYLEPTRSALDALLYRASYTGRPRGQFPPSFGGQEWMDTGLEDVKRAQQLLIKYGDLMVEKGLLSP